MTEQHGARPGQTRTSPWARELPMEIGRWLRIERDGSIVVFSGKVEVGQNIRTSLAQAVADELRVAPDRIDLVMGDTDRTPFDAGTFGSMTTPVMSAQLRRVAAGMREYVIDCAATRWRVPRDEVRVADGCAVHTQSGQSLTYGEITEGRIVEKRVDEEMPVTSASDWQAAGVTLPRVNGRAIVTGEHRYPSDIVRPGMLYGKVLRPPSLNARRTSLDTSTAEAMDGVRVVRDGDFVGVVATDAVAASRALASIRADWETEPLPGEDDLHAYLETHPINIAEGRYDGPMNEEIGSIADGISGADRVLHERYTTAYIAHTPLEPRAAVAEWDGGKLTVWTGTQRPFGVRDELIAAFDLDEDDVRVIVPDTGSGYGGKHTGEVAREAACLAGPAGAPVRVAWTREEEFTWAYMRPAAVIEIESGATAGGTITAWECRNYNAGTAGIRPLYEIPHQRISYTPADSPLRQGSYRALAATANHFARETMIDEMAASLRIDPLEFRMRHLHHPRLRAVLTAATERFGWNERDRLPPGHGAGLAIGHEKGSYLATCAEIEVAGPARGVRVTRVVQAFDCGAIVNPDGLQNQVEGAIVQALGGALFEAVEVKDGHIVTASLSRYRVPRFSDMPSIETILLDRKDLPSAGAGETPIVGLAPAVGNAIFAATGIRLRSLPLAPHGLGASSEG